MSAEYNKCVLRIILKHKDCYFQTRLLNQITLFCTSFVNIMKATEGTVKISNMEPWGENIYWESLG